MKLFKVFTAEIIFYIIVFLLFIFYYLTNDNESESVTDFIISIVMLTILCTVTVSKINDNKKALENKNQNN